MFSICVYTMSSLLLTLFSVVLLLRLSPPSSSSAIAAAAAAAAASAASPSGDDTSTPMILPIADNNPPDNANQGSSFPNGPFHAVESRLYGADGRRVTYAGVNWPGAEATMVPEGLQHQSMGEIVARIKGLGANAVRLTYATEMVDRIYEDGDGMRDGPVAGTFVEVLGEENGTAVWEGVLGRNPAFARDITHIEVYDAIIKELARNSIYVHLDNHISKAGWCCSPFDGNAWWGDTYFSTSNWTRGLSYMAEQARTSWPNVMSMSLYNELRPPLGPDTSPDLIKTYNWEVWYEQMRLGAHAIHDSNPDVLIFLSGMDGDMDLGPVVDGTPLAPGGTTTFSKPGFAPGFEDKLVLELHSYDIITPVTDCPSYNQGLFEAGFSAAVDDDDNTTTTTNRVVENRFPVMMTEWGFAQDETTWWNGTYARCVQDFLGDQVPGAGWFVWSLGGSYYVREGRQDADEPWGLLNHDWSGWRAPAFVEEGLMPLVKKTLDAWQEQV